MNWPGNLLLLVPSALLVTLLAVIPTQGNPIGQVPGVYFSQEHQINNKTRGITLVSSLDSGKIASPNFPNSYDPNGNSTWVITVPDGYRIQITFSDFELEKSDKCNYDRVTIAEPHIQEILFQGCAGKPGTLISQSNQVRINFKTDGSTEKKGFALDWTRVVDGDNSSHSGSIKSPNFPNSYNPIENINWMVSVPVGYRIQLTFSDFELETSQGCEYDRVSITELQSKRILFQGCTINPGTLVSQTNQVRINFKTDGTVQKKGFSLNWTRVE